MGIRSGEQYKEQLQTGQSEVWLGGEQVQDVTTHPAIAPAIKSIAKLYDLQHDKSRDYMTFASPKTGEQVGTHFLLPTDIEGLVRRRKMHQTWAESSYGWMGRSTDFMSAMLCSWAVNADFFGDYSDNVRNYFDYVRDNDLFLTHVLINPQIDRSKQPHDQPDEFSYLGVVRETKEGLIVRGAKMLATAGPYADEMLVWPFGRHTDADAKYAISFAIPMNAPGLRQICRESFVRGSKFDHPLSNQFDEMDAILVFDDVLVPWDRVFINQDPERVNSIWKLNSNAFTGHQTSIRLQTKLEFLLGLTDIAMDAIQTSQFPNVQEMIGEISTYVELIRAAVIASEVTAEEQPSGVLMPNVKPLFAIRNSGNRWYPRVRELMELLFAGGLMYQPADVGVFESPIRADIEKYYRGADISAAEKIKIFKAGADATVSMFGARHELYERFYAGDPFFLRVMTQYKMYDKSYARNLAQDFLDGYSVESVLAERQQA
jgi:4-hydroxyphenylacetate 3-monooxygenase oxygenase component